VCASCSEHHSYAGAGLKSNQNISNLVSYLALWDLFWEKIVVLDDADGTVYKCDVVLKLSRKTAVDLVAGRYDVIGYKRGNKPYKKFRDSGMIELKLKENIIQSELVDVSADVAQPEPEKAQKKKRDKKKNHAETKEDGSLENDDDDDDDDIHDDLSSLLNDMISIVVAEIDDYTRGIAYLLVSGIIDSLSSKVQAAETAGVFMEGPLIDMRSLPWESEVRKKMHGNSDGVMPYSDSVQMQYDTVSASTCSVAEVVDALIFAVEEPQSFFTDSMLNITRPMSSGVIVTLVVEAILQAVETGGVALQSRAPRIRLEGPLVDMRSLPWDSEDRTNTAMRSKMHVVLSSDVNSSPQANENVQSDRALEDMLDITLECDPCNKK
jgi:hypothetical protein